MEVQLKRPVSLYMAARGTFLPTFVKFPSLLLPNGPLFPRTRPEPVSRLQSGHLPMHRHREEAKEGELKSRQTSTSSGKDVGASSWGQAG